VQVLEDRDVRAGQLDILVKFGPNILGGVVAEQNIAGYGLYFVDSCLNRNKTMLAYVPKATVAPWPQGMEGLRVDKACDCPRASYSARVTGQFPQSSARIMVVPVTDGGYTLPVGVTSDIVIDLQASTTAAPQTAPIVTNYAKVTGSFDLALSSQAAANKFASDPTASSAVAGSLAVMAKAPLGNVKVSLSTLKKAIIPNSQGVRRMQSTEGVVRAGYNIAFLQQANGSASTAQRYPQAFDFAKAMQDSNAGDLLTTLVVGRLQAASGGVNNIYPALRVKQLGPLKIEEISATVPVSTNTSILAPMEEDTGMDPTMQIVVAASGATGAIVSISVIMVLTFWCCRFRRAAETEIYYDDKSPRRICCFRRAGGRGLRRPFDKSDIPFARDGQFNFPGGDDLKRGREKFMYSGQEVMVFSRSQGTWVLGHVKAVEDDGSVRVRYMHGTAGHEKFISFDKVATSLRQAYHRGQAVRVFSEEQRRWVDGTIKVVQMDESLVIQAEGPGAPERLVIPRSLLKTNVRRLQYNNNTNTFTDNHFSARRGRLGDFIAM